VVYLAPSATVGEELDVLTHGSDVILPDLAGVSCEMSAGLEVLDQQRAAEIEVELAAIQYVKDDDIVAAVAKVTQRPQQRLWPLE